MGDFRNVLTVGPRGPMLLEDTTYLDEISHFAFERIPERVVHAKGAGAFGYFEVKLEAMIVIIIFPCLTHVAGNEHRDYQILSCHSVQ